MGKGFWGRAAGLAAVVIMVSAPLAFAGAAFADGPTAQSFATVFNGNELRKAWKDPSTTLITLGADIDLGVGLNDAGAQLCTEGEPLRTAAYASAITVDGKGTFGITQSCPSQRVLRDDKAGETVTLTGLTHFTGGDADGHGGGLRNKGPVNVVDSNISGNTANQHFGGCVASADAHAQDSLCEDGDGGGVYANDTGSLIVGPGYDVTVTNSVIQNNHAADDGGGVFTQGSLTATDSHFNENVAAGTNGGGGRGGGAYADVSATITGTTFDTNDAQCGTFNVDTCLADSDGGGFHTYGPAHVTGSTFTYNHAYDSGGGFYTEDNGTAKVDTSTFTGNNAGGEGGLNSVGMPQLPSVLSKHVQATDGLAGSQFCNCVGGGFAAVDGSAQVTGSTFVANGAGCNVVCDSEGGGFYASTGSTVSGSTFGDPSDPQSGSNSAGCFEECGALGGGFFSGGDTAVDTSNFVLNGVGCGIGCNALGGGFFAGNDSIGLAKVSGLTDKLSAAHVKSLASSEGSVTVDQTTLTLNEAGCETPSCGGSGGGFYASEPSTVGVTASTFDRNDSLFDGGAFAVNGGYYPFCASNCGPNAEVTVTNSTITGNTSGFPAAISVAREGDSLLLVNDTIDSNAILDHSSTKSTKASAPKATACDCWAANIFAWDLTSFGTVVTHPLYQSLNPTAAAIPVENCWYESSNSNGYNFSDDGSCNFNDSTDNVANGNDPKLGVLADNGGPTQTMLPQSDSPLIDLIKPSSACEVNVDQRGISRPQAKGCDTGAVEVLSATLRVDKTVSGLGTSAVPYSGTYTFEVECSDGTDETVVVTDPAGGSAPVVDGIAQGSTCTVVEKSITIAGVTLAPTYSPVGANTSGIHLTSTEGTGYVVTVDNDYAEVLAALAVKPAPIPAAAVQIAPKFTG